MKRVSVLLLIVLANFCFAQSSVLYNLNNGRLLSTAVNKIGINGMDENEYEGSPYLEKEFLPSTITGEKGTFLLRYNIYNDEVILKSGDEYFKLPKEIERFTINGKFIIRRINNSYYIESSLENKNYLIVRKEKINFIPAKASTNNYQQSKLAKFTSGKPDFFLYNTESKKLFPLNKNDLKNDFPQKSHELDKSLKTNKLKTTKDFNDLLDIIVK